jgi:hypothetical protein
MNDRYAPQWSIEPMKLFHSKAAFSDFWSLQTALPAWLLINSISHEARWQYACEPLFAFSSNAAATRRVDVHRALRGSDRDVPLPAHRGRR